MWGLSGTPHVSDETKGSGFELGPRDQSAYQSVTYNTLSRLIPDTAKSPLSAVVARGLPQVRRQKGEFEA